MIHTKVPKGLACFRCARIKATGGRIVDLLIYYDGDGHFCEGSHGVTYFYFSEDVDRLGPW